MLRQFTISFLGNVNKQNDRSWNDENPHLIHEKPLHQSRVTVWIGVTSTAIIGPYFYEENGVTVTVNGERYLRMLENFVVPELLRKRIRIRRLWFQQDGAPPHIFNPAMQFLRDNFGDRIISRFSATPWPPRSPDLSILDFFIWGYIKNNIYKEMPRTIAELKTKITRFSNAIPVVMLQRSFADLRRRLLECQQFGGGHLINTIFKT